MTKQEYINFSLDKGLKVKIDFHECTLSIANYKDCVRHGFLCLRPLSNLTKPIEHNGEEFIPRDSLHWNGIYKTDKGIKIYLDELYLSDFLKLIEWGFDIAGLIEKNEAIDVNTLSENPYK